MNYITPYLPNNGYIAGAIEGALPHIALMTPKKLGLELVDIGIRFYRSIPGRDITWYKWGEKSTLLTAATLRFFNFFRLIPSSMNLSINAFMIFATFISSIKSFSKGLPLLNNIERQKTREWTKNVTSSTFYFVFAVTKLFAFFTNAYVLYSTFNNCDQTEAPYKIDRCYEGFTPAYNPFAASL